MTTKCDFCGSIFTRYATLKKHQQSARYCLRLRGQNPQRKTTYRCKHCGKQYLRSDKYENHVHNCDKKISVVDLQDLHVENQRLSEQIDCLQNQITMMMLHNSNASQVNNRNVVVNALPPITDEELQELSQHLTLDFILEGAKGFADFANNYPFKNRLLCTDRSRKKLKYRNENGEIIDDPYGKKLTQRFFQTIAEKNNELVSSEYQSLQRKVAEIAAEGTADNSNLSELLTKSIRLQDTLRLCNEAASGRDNELTQEFINHLTRKL